MIEVRELADLDRFFDDFSGRFRNIGLAGRINRELCCPGMLGINLPALAVVRIEVATSPARERHRAVAQSAGVQRADRNN